jgi:hypothetical protein
MLTHRELLEDSTVFAKLQNQMNGKRDLLCGCSYTLFIGVVVLLSGVKPARVFGNPPSPIIELSFDVPGSNVVSTGSAQLTGTFGNFGSTPPSMFTGDALGVSAKAGDRALYNTNTLGIAGGALLFPATTEMDKLKSFSILMWINHAGWTGFDETLFEMGANSLNGLIGLYGPDASGQVKLTVASDGQSYSFTSAPIFTNLNQWEFVAVTYSESRDATLNELLRQVRYYHGNIARPTMLITDLSLAKTRPPRPGHEIYGQQFSIAATGWALNPFNGLIDDFRFYGSSTDNSQAFGLTVFEGLRQRDIRLPIQLQDTLVGVAASGGVVSIFWPTNIGPVTVRFRNAFDNVNTWQNLSEIPQQTEFGWQFLSVPAVVDQQFYRLSSP